MLVDRGFFRSAPFLVALVVALVIVGIGLAFWSGGGQRFGMGFDSGCDPIPLRGTSIAVQPTTVNPDATHRVVTWTLPVGDATRGDVRACASSGGLTTTASPDDAIHVVARIVGSGAQQDATHVEAAFARAGDVVQVAAWNGQIASGPLYRMQIEIQLPDTMRYDGALAVDSGGIHANGLMWGNLSMAVDSGGIEAKRLDLAGNVSLVVDSGGIDFQADSVQSGRIRVAADSGGVSVRLPQRADVGYDVTGHWDSGSVAVSIGTTETYEKTEGFVHAVSKDYASKPTQVVVDASVDSGGIEIVAS